MYSFLVNPPAPTTNPPPPNKGLFSGFIKHWFPLIKAGVFQPLYRFGRGRLTIAIIASREPRYSKQVPDFGIFWFWEAPAGSHHPQLRWIMLAPRTFPTAHRSRITHPTISHQYWTYVQLSFSFLTEIFFGGEVTSVTSWEFQWIYHLHGNN